MIPDRMTLLIACAIAAVPMLSLSPSLQQVLGIVYTVHALHGHRRARACYVRASATNCSSTAR